jgi:haloacetate dehalogenase
MFFEGFDVVRGGGLRVRVGGGPGPVVVLLHGHPRTHTTWHRVGPLLAARGFTVVCPDLPGYGESARTAGQSKREMAGALQDGLAALGFDGPRSVVGHDRGCYVAHRLAVDFGAERLVVLDGVPISEALARADAHFAASWWHWFFFAQTAKPAEAIISRDPLAWYRVDPAAMGADNHADWLRAVQDPGVVAAMVEDYRALWTDRDDEAADRDAGRLVTCPTLFGWAARDDMEDLYGADPAALWRGWVDGPVRGARIDSGHHMAEEAPEALTDVLVGFLDQPGRIAVMPPST